jgi:hypothetical protein
LSRLNFGAPVYAKSGAKSVALSANYTLERTGCKSVTAHEKGMKEYALLVLSVAPVPASQMSRYTPKGTVPGCQRES